MPGAGGYRWRRRAARAGIYAVVAAYLIFFLGPFCWMLSTSLKTPEEVYESTLYPHRPTLANYRTVLFGREGYKQISFLRSALNSLLVALGASVLAVAIALPAAYAIERFPFRGRKAASVGMLATQVLPSIIFIVPMFLLFRWVDTEVIAKLGSDLKLLNSLPGLVLAYITFALPFSIFMLRGYLRTIPFELEEAALTDGCGRLGVLLRVTLPLSAPGVLATFLFAFISAWNEFLFAFLFCSNRPTIQVALYNYIGQYGVAWGPLMAAATLVILPVVGAFVFLQRHLAGGLTAGAVKG